MGLTDDMRSPWTERLRGSARLRRLPKPGMLDGLRVVVTVGRRRDRDRAVSLRMAAPGPRWGAPAQQPPVDAVSAGILDER
ncbi:MAG TPA: hypothetical protein VMQ59_12250 [Acidimicrobiales bacterium]|nr:hypothetical protein [Acidimicrobiales bacterium]